jgi:hypothetical protein
MKIESNLSETSRNHPVVLAMKTVRVPIDITV